MDDILLDSSYQRVIQYIIRIIKDKKIDEFKFKEGKKVDSQICLRLLLQ